MLATLLGPLPRPPLPDDAAPEALLDAVLEAQVARGIEPLSTAGWDVPGATVVEAWQIATARVAGLVKAVLDGPITSRGAAERVADDLIALADAGCRWIEVREHVPSLGLGAGREAVDSFRRAHAALGDATPGVHRSLALLAGDADALGIDAVIAGGYASLALDLIDGPDGWRLIRALPGDLGVIAGALATRSAADLGREVLVWAAQYAASTNDRGLDRVGLATAGSMANLTWEQAMGKLDRLADGAALATSPADDLRRTIDPRAVDIRSAALGRFDASAPRAGRRPGAGGSGSRGTAASDAG